MKTLTEKELTELDILLAEKAMGWTVKTGDVVQMICYEADGKLAYLNFNPTTDSAAAMEVLKKCGQKTVSGTQFVCASFSEPGISTLSANGHWNVGRIKDGHWDGEIGHAETIELAICLFARKLFA